MQATVRYIQELTDQLSQLARQDGLHDLAYLLRMASEEARATLEHVGASAPSATPNGPVSDPD